MSQPVKQTHNNKATKTKIPSTMNSSSHKKSLSLSGMAPTASSPFQNLTLIRTPGFPNLQNLDTEILSISSRTDFQGLSLLDSLGGGEVGLVSREKFGPEKLFLDLDYDQEFKIAQNVEINYSLNNKNAEICVFSAENIENNSRGNPSQEGRNHDQEGNQEVVDAGLDEHESVSGSESSSSGFSMMEKSINSEKLQKNL